MLSVCTNACWAIGELAVTSTKESKIGTIMKEALNPYAQQITQKTVILLCQQKLNKTLA